MLRGLTALVSLAALTGAAYAGDPVAIAPIQFGDELIEKAEDEYGVRELDRLARYLQEDLERELRGHLGQGGHVLHVTILDADPNRPTPGQMAGRPGLHHSSIGIGGAELEARLVDAEGNVLETYGYRWRSHSISDVIGYSIWTDARRTFDRFADQIGDSLDAREQTGS